MYRISGNMSDLSSMANGVGQSNDQGYTRNTQIAN